MNFNPLIYSGLGFLLGVLITAIVNHFLTKDRERQFQKMTVFSEAARKFRSVIADEITKDTIHVDLSSLDKIQAAIIEFNAHLTAIQKQEINQTWEKYKTLENNRASQYSVYGLSAGGSMKIEILNEFLKFTE